MPTADTSNSFIALTPANDYFDARLNAGKWNAADDDDKSRALIQGTRLLRTYLIWDEDLIYEGVIDFENPSQEMQDAACEMALVLLSGDMQVKDDLEGLALVSLSGMKVQTKGKKKIIPDHVYRIVSHLAKRKGGNGSVRIVRS